MVKYEIKTPKSDLDFADAIAFIEGPIELTIVSGTEKDVNGSVETTFEADDPVSALSQIRDKIESGDTRHFNAFMTIFSKLFSDCIYAGIIQTQSDGYFIPVTDALEGDNSTLLLVLIPCAFIATYSDQKADPNEVMSALNSINWEVNTTDGDLSSTKTPSLESHGKILQSIDAPKGIVGNPS